MWTPFTFALTFALATADAALAGGNAIAGQVVDRNGAPVPRARVKLWSGGSESDSPQPYTELVTDRDGRFRIDYFRSQTGERMKLAKKTEYTLEIWKLGFHLFTVPLAYRRGELVVDTVTMLEDSLDPLAYSEQLDPALYSRSTQSSGATYEGQ